MFKKISRIKKKIFYLTKSHKKFSTSTSTTTTKLPEDIINKKKILQDYDVFSVIGKHRSAPEKGIWMNGTHRFGYFINFVRSATLMVGMDVLGEKKFKQELIDFFKEGNFTPTEIVSRYREQGSFAYFENSEIASQALEYVRTKKFKNRYLIAYEVKGEPFIEDLVYVDPSVKLNVELPKAMYQEVLFDLFRKYGAAVSARNCLHNYQYKESGPLLIEFVKYSRFQKIWDFFKSPKLLPLVAIAVSILIYIMVEPFRLFNVTKTLGLNIWGDSSMNDLPDHIVQKRVQDAENLKTRFLHKPESSILILEGAEGTGKSVVLKKGLYKRRNTIYIDCNQGIGSKDDLGSFIDLVENSIGFKPTFSSITKLVNYIETFLPMKKEGLTITKHSQMETVLSMLDTSLMIVSSILSESSKVYPVIVFDGFEELFHRENGDKTKEELTQEREIMKTLKKWSAKTSKYAHIVFVINSKSFKEELIGKNTEFRNKIESIDIDDLDFKETQEFLVKYLRQLEQKPEKFSLEVEQHDEISGTTLSLWEIMKLIKKKTPFQRAKQPVLGAKIDQVVTLSKEENESIEKIFNAVGGRMSDLTSLLQRITTDHGKHIADEISEIIRLKRKGLVQVAFGDELFHLGEISKQKQWNQVQMWEIMKSLSAHGEIPYTELLYGIFEGNERGLSSLIRCKLVDLKKGKNGEVLVSPYSPLTLTVFKKLILEKEFSSRMENLVKKSKSVKILKKMKSVDEEMKILGDSLPSRKTDLLEQLKKLDKELRNLS